MNDQWEYDQWQYDYESKHAEELDRLMSSGEWRDRLPKAFIDDCDWEVYQINTGYDEKDPLSPEERHYRTLEVYKKYASPLAEPVARKYADDWPVRKAEANEYREDR